MVCDKCGAKIEEGHICCPNCGELFLSRQDSIFEESSGTAQMAYEPQYFDATDESDEIKKFDKDEYFREQKLEREKQRIEEARRIAEEAARREEEERQRRNQAKLLQEALRSRVERNLEEARLLRQERLGKIKELEAKWSKKIEEDDRAWDSDKDSDRDSDSESNSVSNSDSDWDTGTNPDMKKVSAYAWGALLIIYILLVVAGIGNAVSDAGNSTNNRNTTTYQRNTTYPTTSWPSGIGDYTGSKQTSQEQEEKTAEREVFVENDIIYNYLGEEVRTYQEAETKPVFITDSSNKKVFVLCDGELTFYGPSLDPFHVADNVVKVAEGYSNDKIYMLDENGTFSYYDSKTGKISDVDYFVTDFWIDSSRNEKTMVTKERDGEKSLVISIPGTGESIIFGGDYVGLAIAGRDYSVFFADKEGVANIYKYNTKDKTQALLMENVEFISASDDGKTIFLRNPETGEVFYYNVEMPRPVYAFTCKGDIHFCSNIGSSVIATYIEDGNAYQYNCTRHGIVVPQYALETGDITEIVYDDNSGYQWMYSDSGVLYDYTGSKPIVLKEDIVAEVQDLKVDGAGYCYYLDDGSIYKVRNKVPEIEKVASDVEGFVEIEGRDDVIAYADKDGNIYRLGRGEFELR